MQINSSTFFYSALLTGAMLVLATACRSDPERRQDIETELSTTAEVERTQSKDSLQIQQDTSTTRADPYEGSRLADDVDSDWQPEEWPDSVMMQPALLDTRLKLDLRYAGTANFVEEQLYPCAKCLLRPVAARALLPVQDSLANLGLGLLLLDCYRPLSVQWRLWNKVPDRRYVADPRKGSQHNRGLAVDLTLYELSTGQELDMGTPYDYFGVEAWHRSDRDFAEDISQRRVLLLELMTHYGWRPTSSEWWHYSMPLRGAAVEQKGWTCP